MLAFALSALAVGCDQGSQQNESAVTGPPLAITGTNLSPSQSVPSDGAIQIAFNRLLHPATVVRQSFILEDVEGNGLTPEIQYDPVARIVTLIPPADDPFVAGHQYKVIMPVPQGEDLNSGPRAIDLATLPSTQTIEFQAGPAAGILSIDRPIDFCNDVIPIFQSRCAGGLCHGSPAGTELPAEGLILTTPTGIANTGIGRVSQESNTGAQAGLGAPAGRLFGVDMPIVDSTNDPGNSWLMYKVLLGAVRPIDDGLDAGDFTCGEDAGAPASVFQTSTAPLAPLSADEQQRLSDFILGQQMPYPLNLPANVATPSDEPSTLPCTFDELERIRAWITQGAQVEPCNSCPGN